MNEGGIFTTARVRHGEIVHAEHHARRLFRDATFMAPTLVPKVAPAMKEAAVAARGIERGSIRVSLGEQVLVTTSTTRRSSWRKGDKALEIALAPDPRSGSALWVKTEDRCAFADIPSETLLVGPHGELREGTWFHVALFLDDGWCLPAVGEGVIYGTTRAWFVGAASANECSLDTTDLCRATGAVALSALIGIAPIASIGSQTVAWSEAAKARTLSLSTLHLA